MFPLLRPLLHHECLHQLRRQALHQQLQVRLDLSKPAGIYPRGSRGGTGTLTGAPLACSTQRQCGHAREREGR